jgi:hypothetical protein
MMTLIKSVASLRHGAPLERSACRLVELLQIVNGHRFRLARFEIYRIMLKI